jgi:hypothetical protein
MLKQARLILSPASPIDATDLLPTVPLPNTPRPNAEELRKEVEAMMASFQPQPVETQMLIRVPQQLQLVTVSQQQLQQQQQQQQQLSPILHKRFTLPEGMTNLNGVSNLPIKIQLPQHPEPVSVVSTTTTSRCRQSHKTFSLRYCCSWTVSRCACPWQGCLHPGLIFAGMTALEGSAL